MSSTTTLPSTGRFRFALWAGWFLLIGAATMMFSGKIGDDFTAAEMIQSCLVALLFAGIVFVILARARAQMYPPRRLALALSIPLWWYLVVLEQLFPRRGTSDMAYAGNFGMTAYAEALMWVVMAVIIAVVTVQWPQYLRDLMRGSYKWVTLYTLVCVFSVSYAPRPAFALAWAFKLVLVVVLLRLCWSAIQDEPAVLSFLRANLWAFFILACLPVAQAFANPEGAFAWGAEGYGRLNAVVHPVSVSQWGGCLLLLALLVGSLGWRKHHIVLAAIGATVMVMAGGKAAALAGIVAALLLFALQRRFGAALTVSVGMLVVGSIMIMVTPLGTHLRTYSNAGLALTLTGRTELWAAAMNDIKSHFLLGQGYMSSRFISIVIEDVLWDPGHMHNGFLEVLYNTGLLGFIPMIMIHGIIIKNAVRTLRSAASKQIHTLAAGCLALYVFLLLNGMVEAAFGGRATSFFMLLLVLLPFSEFIASRATVTVPERPAQAFRQGIATTRAVVLSE